MGTNIANGYIVRMARPSGPSYTVPNWATTTNYPAGPDPWAGTPTKVLHPGPTGGFVPSQGGAAQHVNYNFNNAFATDQAAKTYFDTILDFVGQSTVQSFIRSSITDLVSQRLAFCPVWNPIGREWVASSSEDTGPGDVSVMVRSFDGGLSWNRTDPISTPTKIPRALAMNPATGTCAALSNTAEAFWGLPSNAHTWTAALSTGLTANAASVFTSLTYVPFLSGVGGFIAIGYDATGAATKAIVTDGITLAGVQAGVVPAGILSTCRYWQADTSPTKYIAVPFDVLNVQDYIVCNGPGGTFTTGTFPGGMIGASERVRDIHYNPTLSLWMAVVGNGTSFTFRVYTSPDGVTWTLRGSPASTNLEAFSLRSSGTLWVIFGRRRVTGIEPGVPCVFYSTNEGVTWREHGIPLARTSTGTFIGFPDVNYCKIGTDGNRFVIADGHAFCASAVTQGQSPTI